MDLTPEGLATACSALFSGDRRPLYERLHVLRHRLRDWEDLEATLENATGLPVDGRCLLLPDIQAAVRASADAVARFDFRGDDRLGDAAFHFDIALHRDAHGVTDWRRDLVERLGGRAAFADVHASLLFPVYSLRTAVLRSSPGGGTRRDSGRCQGVGTQAQFFLLRG